MRLIEIKDIENNLVQINKQDIAGVKFNILTKNMLNEYKGKWKYYRNIFGFKTNQCYFVGEYNNIENKIYSVIFYLKNNDGISIGNTLEICIGHAWQSPCNDNQEDYNKEIKALDNKFEEIKRLIKE